MPASNSYLLSIGIAVLVVGRFLMRELRERKLGIVGLFITPGIVALVALVLIVSTFGAAPAYTGALAVGSLVAIVVGGAIGIAVAHYTSVRIEPGDPGIWVRGSYVTVGIWIAALLLRFAARFFIAGQHSRGESLVANTALVVMVASALTLVRVRVWLRARDERARSDLRAEPAF